VDQILNGRPSVSQPVSQCAGQIDVTPAEASSVEVATA
jgi:hypothetical protein